MFPLILFNFFNWHDNSNKKSKSRNTSSEYTLFYKIMQGEKTMTATTKTKAKTRTNTQTAVSAQAEVSRGAVATMVGAGAIVGLWSIASLASAMVMTGGPVSLAKAWIGAVAGL